MFDPKFPLFEEAGIEGGSASISDDVALLSEGEVESPIKEEESSEIPKVESKEEPKEKTAESEEEPFHPFDRPSVKEINEKFPDFFKAFPQIRDMYFREAEFSKVFPTIEDAKDAAKDVEVFRDIRDNFGRGEGLLKYLDDQKQLDHFASSFFPTLIKTKGDAFWLAANPLLEDVSRSMFNKGIREGNENLQNAARVLSDYFFGDLSVAEGKKTFVKPEDPVQAAERKVEEKYDYERYITFRASVSNSIRDEMSKAIGEGDKLSGLSPFLKSVITDKIIESIGDSLQKNGEHLRHMDSLWDRAKKNGRTEEDKTRLTHAFLARAKSLIPSLRAQFLTEVNGKGPEASAEKINKVSKVVNRAAEASGRPTETKVNYNPKKIDYRKTSDMDILNDNISYKN